MFLTKGVCNKSRGSSVGKTIKLRGWVGPGPVWTGAENLDPPGFDPRTVQPIASRYTDWAIPALPFPIYIYTHIHMCAPS
jgi:hypothetical protein